MDASAAQLGLAQQAAPEALLVQADMTRLALRPGSLDAVASFYALGHVPAECHGALLASIGRWLRPGGLLLTSAPLDAGNSRDDNWLGVPMFFGGIGQTKTQAALQDAGMTVLDWQVVPEDEGDGHTVTFLWLVAERRGEVPLLGVPPPASFKREVGATRRDEVGPGVAAPPL